MRNATSQPMSLGFQAGSASAVDNDGDRLKSNNDGVKGIGLVTGSQADPQFVLNPGQERTFSVGYYKGIYKGTIFGMPDNSNTQLLWYRKDLVPNPPTTWAQMIQDRLGEIHYGPDRGAKQAGFAVLRGTYMPAVLVEIGFISNAREEGILTDGDMQHAIAVKLADAVKAYFDRPSVRPESD